MTAAWETEQQGPAGPGRRSSTAAPLPVGAELLRPGARELISMTGPLSSCSPPLRGPTRVLPRGWPVWPWPLLLAPQAGSSGHLEAMSSRLTCLRDFHFWPFCFPGSGIAAAPAWIWVWGLLAAWRCCVTWPRKEYIVIDFQAACQCVGFGKRTFLCGFTEDRGLAVDFCVILERSQELLSSLLLGPHG